jgi:MinD-like ATPase involved in chromosome partitioning or flagellar assembly
VVSSTELASVVDTYGSIKILFGDPPSQHVHTLVNMADGSLSPGNVHRRLAKACERFLGIRLEELGHVDQDPRVIESGRQRCPIALAAPESPAARQIARAAKKLLTEMEMVNRPDGRARTRRRAA